MNRLIICIVALAMSMNVFCKKPIAETISTPSYANVNNELKLNLATSAFGFPEVGYERYVAENIGVGLSALASVVKSEENSLRYMVTPYCRVYFGTKKASGFFIEANMLALWEKERYVNYNDYYSGNGYPYEINSTVVTQANFTTSYGYGAATGYKFLTKNGLLGELCVGIDRLNRNNRIEPYPRIGVSLGKQF